MKNRLLSAGTFALVALASPAAARNEAPCSADWPQAGTLYLDGPGQVTVYRYADRRPITAGNGAPMCIEDLIPRRPNSGRVVLLTGEVLPFAPNQPRAVPDRRWSLFRLFRNPRRRLELFTPAGAGSLGSERPGFPLRGVEEGVAEIGMNHRRLIIPVNDIGVPQVVELWAPRADRPQAVTVAAGSGEADFVNIRPRRGPWRVVIRREPPIVGGFTMVDRAGDPEVAALAAEQGFTARESALALACIDPLRHGLEGYVRAALLPEASREDRAAIRNWRDRTLGLGCGTPMPRPN